MGRRPRRGPQTRPVLDEAGLDALGGLNATLDRHADEAFGELDTDQQATAEILFRALTERAKGERDIRRPVKISEVAAVAGKTLEQVIACTEPFRRADRNFLIPPLLRTGISTSVLVTSSTSPTNP